MWEIAELRKPHSVVNRAEILVKIRKRVLDRYYLQHSDEVPVE